MENDIDFIFAGEGSFFTSWKMMPWLIWHHLVPHKVGSSTDLGRDSCERGKNLSIINGKPIFACEKDLQLQGLGMTMEDW